MKGGTYMNENRSKVDYIFFESEMARSERHIKRLWISLIVSILATIITNVAWLYYISQYDFEDYDYTLSARDGGNASFIGGDGDISYGESTSFTEDENTERPQSQR